MHNVFACICGVHITLTIQYYHTLDCCNVSSRRLPWFFSVEEFNMLLYTNEYHEEYHQSILHVFPLKNNSLWQQLKTLFLEYAIIVRRSGFFGGKLWTNLCNLTNLIPTYTKLFSWKKWHKFSRFQGIFFQIITFS